MATMTKKTENSKNMKISTLIGDSKRLTLTYVVLIIWVGLAVFAIIQGADFYGLAVYFASGLPLILGYLWSETSRPSPTIKDAAEILKNIGSKPAAAGNYQNYSNYGGNSNSNVQTPNNQNDQISIYSDDASVELKVSQNQLTTLMNIGYVDSIGDKFTFQKSLLDQIKSLINDNAQEPTI